MFTKRTMAAWWKLAVTVSALLLSQPSNAQSQDPDKTPGSTGSVKFTYQEKPVTLKTVRAMDGNIWLAQNLGSSSVATDPKDRSSYGDLFQWGRWDDAHQTREPVYSSKREAQPNNPAGLKLAGRNPYLYEFPSAWWLNGTSNDQWSASTPSEATATNGCDPCKALGADWRLPTIDEWQTLIAAEEITDGSSGIYSNLKLSYGGERQHIGVGLLNVGISGMWWSSTATNKGGRILQVYAEGAGAKQAAYRGVGASIRCIKKSN